jgi:sugar transferase (PEP-CTERM/EpsH1 system associated)
MMNRIRIMHVVHSLGVGGTEEGVRKLLVGLDSSVFEQVVCTVLAGASRDPETGTRVVNLGRSPGHIGFLVPDLTRVFARERPQIVHSRNWGTIEAIPAARLARVSGVVHSEHGLDVHSMNGQPWRRRALRRLCFRWADRTFAVSRGLRDHYVTQLGVPANRLAIIANGVDTRRFRPDPAARAEVREYLCADESTLVVGTVGRLDPVKGHGILLRAAELAFSRGVRLKVVIIGDGPGRAALQEQVRSSPMLHERTVLAGEILDVPRWLNSFDVFVLPSLAEGMSNTLLEAMAVGIAPLASRVGGNPEVIEEGRSGLLFEAGDSEALAAHLKILALDATWRQQLGRNARQRVDALFSLQRMLQNYERMYLGVRQRSGMVQPALAVPS